VGPKRQRKLGRAGEAIVRRKRQLTMPVTPFSEAGLEIGARLRFRARARDDRADRARG
jgi:hypothetical protein